MTDISIYLNEQRQLISLEKQAQQDRYGKELTSHSLKELKQLGAALHPLKSKHNYFGPGDFPQIDFEFLHPVDTSQFRPGTPVVCFVLEEGEIEASLADITEKGGTIRLHSEDFPDWIDERGLGIKIAPDSHTFDVMSHLLKKLEIGEHTILRKHLRSLQSGHPSLSTFHKIKLPNNLNSSQQEAVTAALNLEGIMVLHGPPGTGKTTTLTHLIHELTEDNKTIVAAAPSNAAVDHLTRELVKKGIPVIRLGNNIKISEDLLPYTPEGILERSDEQKQIKKLKKQAEEYRKMAGQYKRKFGKEEREQRSLLYKEVKSIRQEIKALRNFVLDKAKSSAAVITGTPVALYDELGPDFSADYVLLDEAGQCQDPLGWAVAQYGANWILAGDPFQLPPTYISEEIVQKKIGTSILDTLFTAELPVHLLDTQYRMDETICGFSNTWFYEGKLKSSTTPSTDPLRFFDTAGSGFEEAVEAESGSRYNEGEIEAIEKFLEQEENQTTHWTIITPYQGQIRKLKERENLKKTRISTIDSFQGQEDEGIIISLVRSNPDQEIGFLRDYRRMNVALTRAKKHLVVFGDSSTIGSDSFFGKFLEYCEKENGYRSVFELIY